MDTLLDICKKNNFDASKIKTLELQDKSLLYSLSINDLNYEEAEKIHKEYSPIFKGEDREIKEWIIWVFEKTYGHIELWETDESMSYSNHIVDLHSSNMFMVQRLAPGVLIGFGITPLADDCMRIEVNRYGPPAQLN